MKVDEIKRDKLIKEIIDKNPRLILITGSIDPTFSGDSFSYCLAQFNNELIQFSGAGRSQYESKTKVVTKSKFEWLKDIILRFEELHEMTLMKEKDTYIIFDDCDLPLEEYYYEGHLIIDYGGTIELIL